MRQLSDPATPVHVEGASARASHSLGGLGVRGLVWRASLGVFAAHPLVGVGPGVGDIEEPRLGVVGIERHRQQALLTTRRDLI